MLKGLAGKYGRLSVSDTLAPVSMGSSGGWVGVALGETVSSSNAAAGKLPEDCSRLPSLAEDCSGVPSLAEDCSGAPSLAED